MPPPVLGACTEPLGVPDMRGTWRAVSVEWKDGRAPKPDPMREHVECIEQCGNRVCITPRASSTTCARTGRSRTASTTYRRTVVHVVCTFEDGVHVLRPDGLPGVEVTRRSEGEQLIGDYGPLFVARLERVT